MTRYRHKHSATCWWQEWHVSDFEVLRRAGWLYSTQINSDKSSGLGNVITWRSCCIVEQQRPDSEAKLMFRQNKDSYITCTVPDQIFPKLHMFIDSPALNSWYDFGSWACLTDLATPSLNSSPHRTSRRYARNSTRACITSRRTKKSLGPVC